MPVLCQERQGTQPGHTQETRAASQPGPFLALECDLSFGLK